jgi:hypothetical protein
MEGSVPDDKHLLLFADPQRFWGLIATNDAKRRFDGCRNPDGVVKLDDVALCEILRYGVYHHEEMIQPLAQLYQDFVMKLPKDRRWELYRHVSRIVEASSDIMANALLPFMVEDDDRQIASTAAINYVSLQGLADNDPMSRVKDVIAIIESGELRNEGAVFGGLLHIGDRRVCQLLLSLRESLDREAIREATNCQTGFIYAATAEFYIDWLEGLEGDRNDQHFGLVAAGLGLLKKRSQSDEVYTGQRPFPTRSVSREEWAVMRKPVPYSEYLKHIAPRMYALELAEPPLRVMPHVLAEWGLKPKTDPSETEPLS